MAIKLSELTYRELCEDNGGYCLKCKEEAYGVEPDARKYECEECGAHAVYGIEELLTMGQIQFIWVKYGFFLGVSFYGLEWYTYRNNDTR